VAGFSLHFLVVPKWRDLVFIIIIMHVICICVVPVWRELQLYSVWMPVWRELQLYFCVDALVAGIISGSYSYKSMHFAHHCIALSLLYTCD
jgi:hypothetical protein